MEEETQLFDWIRHYGVLIFTTIVAGLAVGAALVLLGTRPYEAWALLVQRGDLIPPLELGRTAQAVFRSEPVYAPALDRLGLDIEPGVFLDGYAELRPVPETDGLVVVGRSIDPAQAQAIADAMADSLRREFEVRGLATLVSAGRAAPVERGLSSTVAGAAGAAAGFWLGVGAAILHFRLRRPVLSLHRALTISGADHVASLDGRQPRWLGALRRIRSWRRTPWSLSGLTRLAEDEPPVASRIRATGIRDGERVERELAEAVRSLQESRSPATLARDGVPQRPGVGAPAAEEPVGPRAVLVAHPGTPAAELLAARQEAVGDPGLRGSHLDLVWLR